MTERLAIVAARKTSRAGRVPCFDLADRSAA